MKGKFVSLMLAGFMALAAQAQKVPQLSNVLSRESFSLNGAWHYIVDVQEEGYYDYRMNPTSSGFFINSCSTKQIS